MKIEFTIRPANPDDVADLFGLIKALAEYEKLSHRVTGNVDSLQEHLFGTRPYAEAIVAEADSLIVGFALFFPNYSTFLTKPGIYLEDVFVLPEYRRQGIGKALLIYLGKLALERDVGRLEWSVLDWNQSAIDFYQTMGAKVLPDWRICRVTGDALQNLATKDELKD
ncbi:MAG: GNAT family N-acetyltransferase [Xenococcaceae cyanobacterium MO_188.B29]|nr:GNAT family N-acetyltransferase [Xenococcaceae cyanobacterium MO_188.B29]